MAGVGLLCVVNAVGAAGGGESVASAGSVSVPRQEVEALLATLPAERRGQLAQNPAALEQWTRDRLAGQLLLQEATSRKWEARPEVAAQLEAARREVVTRSYLASVSQVPADFPSESELNSAYQRSKASLLVPAGYRVSQVFIPAPAGDKAAQARARKSLAEVVKKARQPKADFSRLVAEYGKTAGSSEAETGWVTLDQLLPEVRPVVVNLTPGDISEPVQSAAGFHVLKLVELRAARAATLDEARPLLRERMRQERQSELANRYLDGLANGAAVKVDSAALKSILDQAATPAAAAPAVKP